VGSNRSQRIFFMSEVETGLAFLLGEVHLDKDLAESLIPFSTRLF